MSQDTYRSNAALNAPISYDEVEKVSGKLKYKKFPGIENIPNEVLRCEK